MHAAKLDNLILVLRIYRIEKKERLLKVVLDPLPHASATVCEHTHKKLQNTMAKEGRERKELRGVLR